MARAGIELWQIQLFARWESSVILQYVREAPLAKSHLLAGRLAQGKALVEHIEDAEQGTLQKLMAKEGKSWQAAVTEKIEHEMGDEVTAEGFKDGSGVIKKAIDEVLTESVLIEDLPQWVVNTKKHHSRAKAHQPRNLVKTFCGWPWAEALAENQALVVTPEGAKSYRQCDTCETRAKARRR